MLRLIEKIRAETSKEFCIGIKLNSVDASGSESIDDTLEQIRLIVDAGIDFIEISGGTYESAMMMAEPEPDAPEKSAPVAVKKSTAERESFFLSFAQAVRAKFPKVVLIVSGGFRTRIGMEEALQSGGCDLIGIGRPAAVLPRLPKEIILNEEVKDEDASVKLKPLPQSKAAGYLEFLLPMKTVGAGMQSAYYAKQIQRIGNGLEPVDSRI